MDRILGKTVYLDIDSSLDPYGRIVCVVYTKSGSNYQNLNYALVVDNYAEYSPYDNDFDHTEWELYNDFEVADSEPSEMISSWVVYIGNKDSKIYHTLTCSSGQKISISNRIYFSSKTQAEASGYRPCSICLPEPLSPSSTARYIGNKDTKKYHTLTCEYGQKISTGNRIYFSSKTETLG